MELYRSHNDIIVNNCQILGGSYRNFAGVKRVDKKTGRVMNEEGKRNFCMIVDPEFVPLLEDEHVNVKYLPKREEDDFEAIPQAYVKVNINLNSKYPPSFYRVNEKGKRKIVPDKLYTLDGAWFENVDLRLNLYHSGPDTASLWVNDGYFTVHVDPITAKYEDLPEIDDDEDEPF